MLFSSALRAYQVKNAPRRRRALLSSVSPKSNPERSNFRSSADTRVRDKRPPQPRTFWPSRLTTTPALIQSRQMLGWMTFGRCSILTQAEYLLARFAPQEQKTDFRSSPSVNTLPPTSKRTLAWSVNTPFKRATESKLS